MISSANRPDSFSIASESAVDRFDLPWTAWSPRFLSASWPLSARRALVLVVAVLMMAAAGIRCYQLGASGFSEDEINKVKAVRAYASGEFSENAEHPMVMKLAMWASMSAADTWNGTAERHGWPTVPAEAALRLPNALAGAAAVGALFLLAESFFGPAVGLWSALFLALDANAAGINRIGKEDSFLVLFLLLGAWCYERARQRHLESGQPDHRWYIASGAMFGLMLASKYMPHYLGLWALFGLAATTASTVKQHASKWFWLALLAAFLLANPAVLLPSTWSYVAGYVQGETITHHGAFFAGRLYPNMLEATPFGLPWYFYLEFIGTKVPLMVLGAMAIGLTELVRRRSERGTVFARMFTVVFLLALSTIAAKFGRYLLVVFVVLDMVAALGMVRVLSLLGRLRSPQWANVVAGALAALTVGGMVTTVAAASPYLGLAQNAVGQAISTPGSLFPNDEVYDAGMREAVNWIAPRAARGASIASDAPGVVGEYLRRAGRSDIEARSLSMRGLAQPPRETWLLAQDSHTCFESQAVLQQVAGRQQPVFVHRAGGATTVRVFRLPW